MPPLDNAGLDSGDTVNATLARLRASTAQPTPDQSTPPTPPTPPVRVASSAIPTPDPNDPGVRIQQESAGQQFDKTGAPLTPAMFKGRPDEWNSPVGVTQVRPSTAFGFFPNVDLLKLQTDPGYNKAVGNAVHSALFQRYGNNATMADIAYNLGTGRLDHLLKEVGDPRKGQVTWGEFTSHLPAETQAYITANGSHSPVSHQSDTQPVGAPEHVVSGTGYSEMFPVKNIFDEMRATQYGAKTEADATLKDIRRSLSELSKPPPTVQPTPPTEVWGSLAMAVAALGGLLTHTPATTALNAMGGVMKAFSEGDQQRAEMAMKQWKVANDALLRTAKMKVDLYSDAMSRYKEAPEQAKAELMANAAALNDQAMVQLLEKGDWQGAMAMGSGGINAYVRLKNESTRTEQALKDRAEAQRLVGDLQQARASGDPQKVSAAEQALRDFNAIRAPAAASVNIESTTATTKQYSPPQEIEITGGDGKKQQILAQQDKNTGAWVTADQDHSPIQTGGGMKLLKGAQGDVPPAGDPTVEQNAKLIAEYKMAPMSGWTLRSPFGQAVMARVAELNPDYNATVYGERAKAVRDFGTGAQGNQTRSFNVAVNHLDTLDRLIGALQNGDVRRINAIAQQVAEETGSTAPTNFDAVKQIIGQEVVKAIVAGGGGVTERQQAAEIVDRARSPEQLHGAIDTLQELMVGQLKGLKQQYEQSTGLKNFDTLLSDRTKAMVGKAGARSSAPPLPMVMQNGKSVPDSSKLQDGQTYTLPNGVVAKFDEKRMGFVPQ